MKKEQHDLRLICDTKILCGNKYRSRSRWPCCWSCRSKSAWLLRFIFFRFYFFINVYMVLFLFNAVIYVFLLLFLCILIVCLCMATLTEVFPYFFLSCKANARVKPAKTGHGPHSSKFLLLFYILFVLCRSCIVCVYMCTVLLPPACYPIAVNKSYRGFESRWGHGCLSFMFVVYCVGSGLFDGLITPSGGGRVLPSMCVIVSDLKTSTMGRPRPDLDR
jgi:hypothetical protein